MAPKTKKTETQQMHLDDKTKKATLRFMKTYNVESVTIQDTVFTPESLGSSPKGTKKEKKEKDPNAPKLPLSCYMRYQNSFSESEREKMKEKAKKQGIKYQALVSEMWKALEEDGQQKYKDAYAEDKKEYDVKKEKYLESLKSKVEKKDSTIIEEEVEEEEEEVEEEKHFEEEIEDTLVKPKKEKTKKKTPAKKGKGKNKK